MNERKISEDLFKLVRRRYGTDLDPKGLEEIKKGVETIAEAIEAMKTVKLEFSDEPYLIFKPFKKED